jgi:hypothetical protein
MTSSAAPRRHAAVGHWIVTAPYESTACFVGSQSQGSSTQGYDPKSIIDKVKTMVGK